MGVVKRFDGCSMRTQPPLDVRGPVDIRGSVGSVSCSIAIRDRPSYQTGTMGTISVGDITLGRSAFAFEMKTNDRVRGSAGDT